MSRGSLQLATRLKSAPTPPKNPLSNVESFDFSAAPDYWKMSPQEANAALSRRIDELHAKLDRLLSLHDQKENVVKMQAGLKELDRLNKKLK